MVTATFKRSRPDGWTVYYEVDDEAARLLELKGMVARSDRCLRGLRNTPYQADR